MAGEKTPLTLIIQDNSAYWTKATRGADKPVQRPRMDTPARLPALPGPETREWIHLRQASEQRNFQVLETCGPELPPRSPDQGVREDVLRWRWKEGAALLRLHPPGADTRQTRWPAHLPDPIAVAETGKLIRIDWNMRARVSLFGSNRSSAFQEHAIFVTITDQPARDIFIGRDPDKHIDLRVNIY